MYVLSQLLGQKEERASSPVHVLIYFWTFWKYVSLANNKSSMHVRQTQLSGEPTPRHLAGTLVATVVVRSRTLVRFLALSRRLCPLIV